MEELMHKNIQEHTTLSHCRDVAPSCMHKTVKAACIHLISAEYYHT